MSATASRSLTRDQEEEAIFSILYGDSALVPEMVDVRVNDPSALLGNSTATVTAVQIGGYLIAQPISHKPFVAYRTRGRSLISALEVLDGYSRNLETVAALRAKVAVLAQLKKNWDGEDGEPVSAETLATTTKVLEHISLVLSRKNILSSPSIRPFPDGSVFFKWVQGQRELTITIHGQNVDVQRWEPLDSYESQGLWEVSVDDAPEHIEWVLT